MPMVKTEERDARVSTTVYTRNGHIQQLQNATQHSRPTVPSDPLLAIALASHETLVGSGNVAYRAAIQELNDLRAAISRYQSLNMELSVHHEAARDAYMRLYSQMKARSCHCSDNYPSVPSSGPQNLNGSRNAAPHNPALDRTIQAPLLPPLSRVSAPFRDFRDSARLPQAVVPPSASVSQVSLSSKVPQPVHVSASSHLTRVSAASSQDSVLPHVSFASPIPIPPQTPAIRPVPAQASSIPPGATSIPPTGRHGGPSTIDHFGPLSVSPVELHSVPSTNELFWNRSDWFRKGCPTNSFITDEHGKPLTYMVKNIRAAARTIWTDIAGRPGSGVASCFKRNSGDFKREFVERIEGMHPCLKLCGDHWKALQVGTSSYNYWYKRVWKADNKRV